MIQTVLDTGHTLEVVVNKVHDPSRLKRYYQSVGAILAYEVNQNFESESYPPDYDTPRAKWQDLTYLTRVMRSTIGKGSGKILQVSGALARSVSYRVTERGVSVYMALPAGYYGKFIHYGTKAYRIPITARSRKFFWFKYFQSKETVFKYMALTKKNYFNRKAMKPRPIIKVSRQSMNLMASAYKRTFNSSLNN